MACGNQQFGCRCLFGSPLLFEEILMNNVRAVCGVPGFPKKPWNQKYGAHTTCSEHVSPLLDIIEKSLMWSRLCNSKNLKTYRYGFRLPSDALLENHCVYTAYGGILLLGSKRQRFGNRGLLLYSFQGCLEYNLCFCEAGVCRTNERNMQVT